MVSDQTYNSVDRGDQDSLGHAIMQLLALIYVYHLEYPQPLQNLYYYLQQFVLADHDLCSMVHVVNSYHEAIQPYLVLQTQCNSKSGTGISIPQAHVLNAKFEIKFFLKKLCYIY